MKRLTKQLAGLLLVSGLSLAAKAQDIRLGQPAYGGSGCPAGTASVTVSPNQKAISVLFDQFVAESGGATGRRIDRKSCNLTIPVYVPSGYSIGIFQVDYRGFNSLPSGSRARFEAEYFWAGARGPRTVQEFSGPLNRSFFVQDELLTRNIVWTPCGDSVNLRVNASIFNQTNWRNDQTLSMVDSADVTGELIYHIQWRRCY